MHAHTKLLGFLLLIAIGFAVFAVRCAIDDYTDRRRARRKRVRRSTPIVCVALGLIVPGLVLGHPARADGPTVATPVLVMPGAVPPAVVVAVPPAVPLIPTPDALAKAQQVTQVAATALHQVQQLLGIPMPTLPQAWYDTQGGKVVVWGSFTLGVASTATGIILGGIAAAARPSP